MVLVSVVGGHVDIIKSRKTQQQDPNKCLKLQMKEKLMGETYNNFEMKGLILVAVVSLLVFAECQYSPEWDTISAQNSLTKEKPRYK
jgi:hypothetical protein